MWQNFQENSSNFLRVHKDVCGVVLMEVHAPPVGQFWTLLLNGLNQMIELLAVFGGIDDLVLWEQLIINYFFDIPPDAQHYLLRVKFGFSSSLETTILPIQHRPPRDVLKTS